MKLQYWYILYGENLFYLSFFYCVCVQILKIHKNDSKLAFAISVNRKKISLHLKYYSLPIVPSFPFGKIHAHTQTQTNRAASWQNRALSPAAYHTNKPVHKKCSLRRWKRSCKAVGRMGWRRFGIFSRLRSRFSRQNRENGGFAAKTFTRAKIILPTKRALKNAAEIQFGTKFLFGLLT